MGNQNNEEISVRMKDYFTEDFASEALSFGSQKDKIPALLTALKKYSEAIKALKASQIRKYFHEIKKSNTENIIMLRPLLIYGVGRVSSAKEDEKKATKAFLEDLEAIIQKITTDEQLKSFKKFIETIVAYHKYYSKPNS